MARVIINGDDFGMNERCSRAIAQAFAKGLITDTTAIANGEWLEDALQLARDNGFSDKIGVHLNLTEGKPLTEKICGFTDFVTDGYFNKRAMTLNRELTAAENDAVYAELEAQILRLKNAGIFITHADSHHYIHNLPCLLSVVVRVCRKHDINKLRLRKNLPDADAEINAYNATLRARGFITTDYFGRPEDILGREIPDSTELLVHPDFDRDGELIDRRGMSDGYPIGDRFPDIGRMNGVELIDYSLM
ncbi:MAG: ChbG/HpnK family deacetylase [Ruminococcus sp.]|uniref:carbohydrate deacetylase n=1 Tax=Ruminococcus sp. TaxID=41978 RepID=UPI002873C183|nr:ChbG/HpnK family deacetylase [Ruminococcus sp.]MBQ3285557.1 ChbG/HpnK family deacetylase [Ruminococcus sp.]